MNDRASEIRHKTAPRIFASRRWGGGGSEKDKGGESQSERLGVPTARKCPANDVFASVWEERV